MTPARPTTPPDPQPDPRRAPRPGPQGPPRPDLHAVFARTASDVTPGPLPLEAVRRAGRARRRRRTTALSALSVLAVATSVVAVVVTLTPVRPSPAAPGPAPVAVPPAVVPTSAPSVRTSDAPPTQGPAPIRTVAPGERVNAGKGWKVWLTAEGKHWAGPDGYENARSVTDGNIDVAEPGVSHQSEGGPKGAFHSGLYYGTRAAGRVELRNAEGRTVVAALLELPGSPGWGVWYVHTGPGMGEVGTALYDRSGKLLSELPLIPRSDPS
ncbi:hypothetical protein J3A78_003431 [Streptomyces sp. PvR006]|uniref:hypothetical protein n=1 Tax=Streptomyces sp. PvR006 TaxID=2817860 RepID=UPI001AE4C354|nr:hypothetical protein [Streptomyces sp. PvR006]MBP2582953.1 hypothetical protein [Streptomyces sp. PvR006]